MALFGPSWNNQRVKELYDTATSPGNHNIRIKSVDSLGNLAANPQNDEEVKKEATKALSKIANSPGNQEVRERAIEVLGMVSA